MTQTLLTGVPKFDRLIPACGHDSRTIAQYGKTLDLVGMELASEQSFVGRACPKAAGVRFRQVVLLKSMHKSCTPGSQSVIVDFEEAKDTSLDPSGEMSTKSVLP